MSRNTRSSHAERSRGAIRALAATLTAAVVSSAAIASDSAASAPALPPTVAALDNSLRPQGGGTMTFLGLSIYDGWLWSESRAWVRDRIYALDLHYHRDLKGSSIAERSVAEIERIGRGTREELQRWGELMRRVFPNVRRGDRITGVNLPPNRVRFFLNGEPIGDIVDPRFGPAFFGIWLDPNTSDPDYRAKLLGQAR